MPSRASDTFDYLSVVTFGRSGSTAIQAALNAHPHTLIRGENYSALRGIHSYLDSIASAADRHHSGRAHHPWFGTAKLDPVAVRNDVRRHVVDFLLRPKTDTTWLGFKEVRYEEGHFATADELADHLMFLATFFPGMRFVINVRDAHLAARSGWWREHPDAVGALERSTFHLQEAAHILTWALGPGRAVVVDHDRWVADPSVIVSALQSVGYPVDASIVEETLSQQLSHGKNQ